MSGPDPSGGLDAGPRLTVLGSCGGFPEPGRACNGFLLEVENCAVLLDLGYGALRHLLTARRAGDVDAIVVTHEHPDHRVDLHALARIMVLWTARASAGAAVLPTRSPGPVGGDRAGL